MQDTLTGETAVITGSSAGIGLAIAEDLADHGARVVTNSRSADRAEEAAAAIREAGGEAVGVAADVTDRESVGELVDAAVSEFGSVDVMVNNAGINVRGPAEEMPPEDWQRVLDVDLTGAFYGAQAAGKRMIEQGDGGQIISVASMMGEMGLGERAPYCAAKGGVINLTRTLAVEWAEHDIHVNAISPGYIKTEMVAEAQDEADFSEADIRNRTPLDRFGTPEEMAKVVRFLAEGGHFLTGENITADGGWSAFAWGSRGE